MNELFEVHKQIFGVEPVVIGLNWDSVEELIVKAIEDNLPYDETKLLTPEELKMFNAGNLVF
jgi:DNA repair photolyase